MFRQAFQIGVRAFVQNWVPALILQSGMLVVLGLYYFVPTAAPAFKWVMSLQERGGLWFSFIASGVATGVIAEVMRVYTVDGGKWKLAHFDNMIFKFLVLGGMGALTAVFYELQVTLFGTEVNFSTIAKKVLVDQMIYSTLIANPIQVVLFSWKNAGYSWSGLRREIFPVVPYIQRQWMPLVATNWMFWTPTISILYALPVALQIPLFIVAASIWGILITKATEARSAA